MKDALWPKENQANLLHIFPQPDNHGSALIHGSNAALRRLGEALIEASKKGQDAETNCQMMTADGEGYLVCITPKSDKQINDGPLPYSTFGRDYEL